MSFDNQSVLVTGAASGIGRAIAQAFASEGAAVLLCDRDEAGLEETLTLVNAVGGRGRAYPFELLDDEAFRGAVQSAVSNFGALNILINNAGIGIQKSFLDTTMDDWDAVMNVNLRASFAMAREAAEQMVAQGTGGRIISMGSIAGQRGISGRAAYATSKAGLHGLNQVIAIELAPYGITCNCIAPGPTDTPIKQKMHTRATREAYTNAIPMRRYGTANDVANAALFLAAKESGYITGHTLNVDGGFDAAGMMFEI